MDPDVPDSRHFTLEKLGEGIYAAIARDGGWAVCNAGAVDLGEYVVVFDTFVNHNVAAEFREMVMRILGKPISFVVNSHSHSDHVKGNQAFTGASIVANTKTRDAMAKAKPRYDTDSGSIRQYVEDDLKSHLAHPEDPDTVLFEGYDRGHLDGLLGLRYTLPDVTFSDKITFCGTKRTAEVATLGGGHTDGDSFLYLPDERIAFMGDLLFVGCHPYLADGDPQELLRILDKVRTLDPKVLVPGHGPIGTLLDIDANRGYVDAVEKVVNEVRGSGGTIDELLAKPFDPAFQGWKWRAFLRDNLESFFQKSA